MLVLLWLLHQKGLFDPLYDWWEDICGADEQFIVEKRKFKIDNGHHRSHDNKHHKQELRHPNRRAQNRPKANYVHNHKHKHSERNSDNIDHLHLVQKEVHKHRHKKHMDIVQHIDDNPAHHKHRKEQQPSTGLVKVRRENYDKNKPVLVYDPVAE